MMTIPDAPGPIGPARSTFVTVVAWIFIVLSGFATFISLLQNVMVAFMPRAVFNEAMQDSTFTRVMPSPARFMLAHFQAIVLAVLIVCLAIFVSSIGLLHRRNWARLLFIGLLTLGIVYNLSALLLQQSMMPSFNAVLAGDSAFQVDSLFRESTRQFADMMAAMRAVVLVVAVGFSALYAWIIARLVSRPIREEFVSAAT